MENKIISALFNHDVFSEYSCYITPELFSGGRHSQHYVVFSQLSEYYNKHKETITPEELKVIHEVRLAGMSEVERTRILDVYTNLTPVEYASVRELFTEFKRNDLKYQIEEALADDNIDKASIIMDKLNTLGVEEEEDGLFSSRSLLDVLNRSDAAGMEWFLPPLSEALPRITKGTGALVVARPNTGKTSFIVKQVLSCAKNGARVLHCSLSEDGEEELLIRYLNAHYKVDDGTILGDRETWAAKLDEIYPDTLRFWNTGLETKASLEARIRAFKPDLVVVDQYQKLLVGKDSSPVENRTKSAEAIKDLAKKYGFFYLCATQADKESTEFITELNIDQNKTGVIGDFKVGIGIGKWKSDRPVDFNGEQRLRRKINIFKNKGRMGWFDVNLAPETAQWYLVDKELRV